VTVKHPNAKPHARALARSQKSRAVQEWLCERLFRPPAHVVVLALAPLRVPPPAVVLGSTASGVVAAVELARGHLIVAALLVQLKTVLDNADGQLARMTGRVTALGRYLDSLCDLLVDAALFAALGWYTGRPLVAALGFVALTALLSLNFNAERLYRNAPRSADHVPVLTLAYALLYGWQDRLVERFLRPDRRTVAVLAQLGMSTQLLTFGVCMALGRPLAYVWLLLAELALVAVLVRRSESLVPETEGVA
jgi:phosphatidylglycerophosphate synthase